MFDQLAKLDELGKTLVQFMAKVNADLEKIKNDQETLMKFLCNEEIK